MTDAYRVANMHLSINELTEIAHRLTNCDWAPLWSAIGYLSTWASGSPAYTTVDIHRDGATDLVAVYRNADGKVTYTIGAVWHDDHYGFHS